MSTNYASHVSVRATPQNEKVPGTDQVENSAGGFVFAVDDFVRLNRFLTLGCEGGTYYAAERKLTKENAECVLRCAALDPLRTVSTIVEISQGGRAPKNDPAIFALALVARLGKEDSTRHLGLTYMPQVCRTGTHLFQFASFCNEMGGWGKGLQRSIREWYWNKQPRDLAYNLVKYQQRDGWSHRDLLRLSKPRQRQEGKDPVYNDLFHWAVKGWEWVGEKPHDDARMLPIWAFERAKRATTKEEVVRLIEEFDLVREAIPTKWLNEPSVWEALLQKMPLTAMVRSLAKMTAVGLLAPFSKASLKVVEALGSVEAIKKARLHPMSLLVALRTYAKGKGDKGSLTWSPLSLVVDALDQAFYLAFQAVEPTNKRWMLALDVSGSMGSAVIGGMGGITAREASAAMALVTANVEKDHLFTAFTTNGWTGGMKGQYMETFGLNNGISPLDISPRMRLSDAVNKVANLPFGGTDCALPMLYAIESKLQVDVFVVLTDSETYANPNIHPCQALKQYRDKMGIPAKLIVQGMTSTNFSIAPQDDAGCLDVAGCDTSTPGVMAEFVRG